MKQERAAWDFMEQEKPNFTLATVSLVLFTIPPINLTPHRADSSLKCNPPTVLGPVVHPLHSLSALNTSNHRTRDLIIGAYKASCPPTVVYLFVDVRDLALAHVLAAEKDEAAGKRFFIVGGYFCIKEVVEIMGEAFPDLKANLPAGEALKPGAYPEEGIYGFDNGRSKSVLGLTYRPLREAVVDTVKSLQTVGTD